MLLGGCVLFACGCVSWWVAAVNVPPSSKVESITMHSGRSGSRLLPWRPTSRAWLESPSSRFWVKNHCFFGAAFHPSQPTAVGPAVSVASHRAGELRRCLRKLNLMKNVCMMVRERERNENTAYIHDEAKKSVLQTKSRNRV